MNLRQVLFGIFLGIFLGIYDVTFSTFAPEPFSFLHLSLPVIAFCIAIERRRLAFIVAIVTGIVFDLFAIGGSGFAVARIVVAAGAAWQLQVQVLTNRSLYATILLALVVRMVDAFWIWALSLLYTVFQQPLLLSVTWDTLWKRAGMDIAIVVVLFTIQVLIDRQFRRRT
jgi:hypothetical protein